MDYSILYFLYEVMLMLIMFLIPIFIIMKIIKFIVKMSRSIF